MSTAGSPTLPTQAEQPVPGVAWFDIADPASPALDELAKRFSLHELQIEDCRHRPQRAKTEEFPLYIFSVLKAVKRAEILQFDDLDVFLGKDFLITVHGGECAVLARAARRIRESADKRLDKLMYFILDAVVDEYQPVLDDIADQIAQLESEVLRRPEPPVLRNLFRVKRRLIEFRRNASAMREVVNGIMRREGGLMGDDLDPYLRDVYDHLVRTMEFIETYRDLLSGALDIYLSAVANRTNEVMKVLAVYSTMALPMVIITGFFGMNLHMPWEESRYGAAFAALLMLLAAGWVLLYFRRKGWF